MKKFNDDIQLKNTVVEESKDIAKSAHSAFQQFLSQFPKVKKLDKGFYSFDDRRVDYHVIKQAAILKKVSKIPTPQELEALI